MDSGLSLVLGLEPRHGSGFSSGFRGPEVLSGFESGSGPAQSLALDLDLRSWSGSGSGSGPSLDVEHRLGLSLVLGPRVGVGFKSEVWGPCLSRCPKR